MKRSFLLVAVPFAAVLAVRADPVVSEVVLTPPRQGVATVTYALSGGPAVITLDIERRTGDGWRSIGEDRLQRLMGDVNRKVEGSGGTISWAVDGAIEAADYRAKVTAWPLTDTPDYMVVSLAKAASAEDRIRYYTSTNALPGGLLANPAYRTTMMVFRKVSAKGVAWKMGSTAAEPASHVYAAREKQHDVTLARNYYLAVFPATQAQCTLIRGAVIEENHVVDRLLRLQSRLNYDWVRGDGWPSAPAAFALLGQARKLTDGLVDFDLPTEAEWEYACRAGHGDGYWGDGSKMTMVSYSQIASCANLDRLARYRNTQAIVGNTSYKLNSGPENCTPIAGSYAPNAWGFYDMNGGVEEYCLDWYQEDITALNGAVNVSAEDGTKCADGTAGANRVVRGGSWVSQAYQVRPAMRGYVAPGYYGDSQQYGFRPKAYMGLE